MERVIWKDKVTDVDVLQKVNETRNQKYLGYYLAPET